MDNSWILISNIDDFPSSKSHHFPRDPRPSPHPPRNFRPLRPRRPRGTPRSLTCWNTKCRWNGWVSHFNMGMYGFPTFLGLECMGFPHFWVWKMYGCPIPSETPCWKPVGSSWNGKVWVKKIKNTLDSLDVWCWNVVEKGLEFEFPKLENPELSEFGTKPTNNFGGEAVKKY